MEVRNYYKLTTLQIGVVVSTIINPIQNQIYIVQAGTGIILQKNPTINQSDENCRVVHRLFLKPHEHSFTFGHFSSKCIQVPLSSAVTYLIQTGGGENVQLVGQNLASLSASTLSSVPEYNIPSSSVKQKLTLSIILDHNNKPVVGFFHPQSY